MKLLARAMGAPLLALVFASGAVAQSPSSLAERGKYLVEGVMACGLCHAARSQGQLVPERGLSGGFVLVEPGVRAVASNITPDPDTGIGRWTDEQLARAIREGVRPDGSIVGPTMPIPFYRRISDDDIKAVVAYLRAQPPVRNEVAKSTFEMPLPANWGPPLGKVTAPDTSDAVRYGEYLATAAHCMSCHTPRDAQNRPIASGFAAGGRLMKGPWGETLARNLTPHESGLKDWTDAQIANATRSGMNPQGVKYKPPMPFAWYRNISDADMAAIASYLRSLPPLPIGGK